MQSPGRMKMYVTSRVTDVSLSSNRPKGFGGSADGWPAEGRPA